ncbi:TlpA family protein disulfide reductase [Chitinophaga horti]|uniref:TlpA family protein disulfide reductase n=1 Tax=Chitinophaga horti TaxID=2920382 RepID=A0ABY6J7Z2_9BACT|nr:TlpA disulfide reductase family protein [Chitinophaga horti]UYQ95794.1 TlpA family protein disulfide reductase [Chitinophaga horti]
MKKFIVLTACLLVAAGTLLAQRGPRNPRLTALMAVKDSVVLRDSLQLLYKSSQESDLQLLESYYEATGDKNKNSEVSQQIRKRFPDGNAAFRELGGRIYEEVDPKQNEKYYQEMVRRFGNNKAFNLDGSRYFIAKSFLGKNQPDKVWEYLNKIENSAYKLYAYSYAARESMPVNDTKLGETLIRKTFADLKGDTTHKGYDEFCRIMSELLYLNGKYEEGEPYAKRIYVKQSHVTSVSTRELASTYFDYQIQLGRYQDVYAEMADRIKKGSASQLVKDKFKAAYVKVNGSDKGYDAFIADAKTALNKNATEELEKQMLNVTAFNFEVQDLNGKKVRLSDYQGKVVILDFWATWCGPCKASFPMMQTAVDRYQHDKDVVFLFIHTLENSANPTKAAADYITDKKFRFNVLMDLKSPETGKNAAARGFEVNAIPAKFVVDKKGIIRFKKVGNAAVGSDAFLAEMDAMIKIAKG